LSTTAFNIGTLELLLGYLLLILSIAIILFFRVRLMKDLTVSLLRLTIQLLFVGLYLRELGFDTNFYLEYIHVESLSTKKDELVC